MSTDHEARARKLWDEAVIAMDDSYLDETKDPIAVISQALREAEEAERERCAKIADHFAEHMGKLALQAEGSHGRELARHLEAQRIAASIRGEKDNG